ncbi:sulfite exporter TauE/SafE family protein [Desulforamulus ruminis]|uniref:Probable membrane transporter protein n=1 Tax=Desulforamulus ruminis (strain ATCC 23193 / DSM 2154 / NCIMB 8452 / DL) TaxID=696281 RepID=F6DRL0_DESRL|nr:sulfite exporter TauE/SafE family protein [Desulforamulus ruminis]AEG58764.1 protein of unknown function DUF81 [Desulforamulus ruminis DSM 2154]
MYEWVCASAIVFVASALQSITGFGFAIMATPFLLLFYNPQDCIQMGTILSVFIALVLTPKIKQHIDSAILKRLIIGSFFGVPLGLVFFAFAGLETIKLSIAVVILAITLYSFFQSYQARVRQRAVQTQTAGSNGLQCAVEMEGSPVPAEKESRPMRKEVLVGFFAGVLTTGVNMPGVPMALYFNNSSFAKEVIRSTTLGFFIVVYITGMIMQLFTVGISLRVVTMALYLIPAGALGIFVGNLLFDKINRGMFQIITNFLLVYIGIYILAESL